MAMVDKAVTEMFWRREDISPKKVLRTYGPIMLLSASLSLNLLLGILLISHTGKPDVAQLRSYEDLAKSVTLRLLDSSYVSFRQSTESLLNGQELSPQVVQKLQKQEILPKTQ